MLGKKIIHRTADGRRVRGTWRHVFIRNLDYHLTDLFIYADGLVDCWGLVTLEEFERKLHSGWVATELPEGADASGFELGAAWRFAEPRTWYTPELLLAEVRDTVDELNGRPTSTDRCLTAVDAFLADRTEERRATLREAYLAIPATQRRYALGDMDHKDGPLKVLAAGPGGQMPDGPPEPVSQEGYDHAIEYFEERATWIAERSLRVPTDGPASPLSPAIHLAQSYPLTSSADPGRKGLRNDYPAPVTVDGTVYPTVTHAYWALATDDVSARAAIAEAPNSSAARELSAAAGRRPGWEHARTAVMARLMRAKYAQHPPLAQILLDTADATLVYDHMDSGFWGDNGGSGRNWIGRLLELVRSEIQAESLGVLDQDPVSGTG
ncbi:NADAR family protein [Streptomyces sp. NPDC058739]|uniref:NADAR family protein n=1 Tax=Streptomyces sp. NPDC058739 TaxID=3346618 RepID=UPI00369CBAD3